MVRFINTKGEWVVPPQFDLGFGTSDLCNFVNGVARVLKDGKWGLINTKGDLIVEPVFEQMNHVLPEGIWALSENKKWGVLNHDGNWKIEPKFDIAYINPWQKHFYVFDNEKAKVSFQEKWGVIDSEGNWILEPEYDEIKQFHHGVALARKDNKWGLINTDYQWVVSPKFDEIEEFKNDFAKVQIKGKWGFVNKDYKLLVKPQYEEERNFRGGIAVVKKDGKWGEINNKGSVIVKPEYDYLSDFSFGIARMAKGKKWGYVDTTGTVLSDPIKDLDKIDKSKLIPIKVSIYGNEIMIDACDENENGFEADSWFILSDKFTIFVNDKPISLDKLGEFKEPGMIKAKEFFTKNDASIGLMYLNKAWSRSFDPSTNDNEFEIYLQEGQDFDPLKAALITQEINLIKSKEWCVLNLVYDGVRYPIEIGDTEGIRESRIYRKPAKK